MSTSIKIENVSKIYQLGQIGSGTAYNDLKRWSARLRGKSDPLAIIDESGRENKNKNQLVYSLKDINLNINQGDAIGIIGRNGAGKSTLLKIISRITSPSQGRVFIKGRVASLLEVGTGFHPELTGRENIYLNGSILGMRKREITRKLDQIIDFSGVETYIDTPVKRYSTGMYVRLAFAVAAHLDSEILIVDEVLAVGDAEFQKKCIGKMGDMGRNEGRTVLFVSHDMGAISQLSRSIVLMSDGRIELNTTDVKKGINRYLNFDGEILNSSWNAPDNQFISPYFNPQFMHVAQESEEALQHRFVSNDNEFSVMIGFNVEKLDSSLEIGIEIFDENNQRIFLSTNCDQKNSEWPKIVEGFNILKATIPGHFLNEGTYRVNLTSSLFKKEWILRPDTTEISVNFRIQGGLSDSSTWTGRRNGIMAPVLKWTNQV